VKASDAVMVARGDLGVEMPIEIVPSIQRAIVSTCRNLNKPVIVATQMLESMIKSPLPTRAEVSDIATAVYQGADAVALSAETASGDFPVEAVDMMRKVIENTEQDEKYEDVMQTYNFAQKSCANLIPPIMHNQPVDYLAAFTESGRTPMDVAQCRCRPTILALTPNLHTIRKMCLVWGVYGFLIEELYSFSQMQDVVQLRLPKFCDLQSTARIAIVAGVPFKQSGQTNILHICEISKFEAE
jgi:pyruvate kinase